jgi:hypothetical protein
VSGVLKVPDADSEVEYERKSDWQMLKNMED